MLGDPASEEVRSRSRRPASLHCQFIHQCRLNRIGRGRGYHVTDNLLLNVICIYLDSQQTKWPSSCPTSSRYRVQSVSLPSGTPLKMPLIRNPILPGFNPDPSILRVGDDYYIATSTFEWYPGVQIHHSKDLANWELVVRPLNRKSQLDMRGAPDSCGVWAPVSRTSLERKLERRSNGAHCHSVSVMTGKASG